MRSLRRGMNFTVDQVNFPLTRVSTQWHGQNQQGPQTGEEFCSHS